MMEKQEDIRWQQCLANFRKARRLLVSVLTIEKPSEIERMGIIQAYKDATVEEIEAAIRGCYSHLFAALELKFSNLAP